MGPDILLPPEELIAAARIAIKINGINNPDDDEAELVSSMITGASIIGSAKEPAKEDDAVIVIAAANITFFIIFFLVMFSFYIFIGTGFAFYTDKVLHQCYGRNNLSKQMLPAVCTDGLLHVWA